MLEDRWLLPEGIEEILPPAARRLERLRRELVDLYEGWGYELVIPPLIEFLDSLLTGTGNDLALQTFKLTDQLSGRMMGVRADMTPQVARIDAHLLKREGPVRLCYMGTVLRTRADGFGGSRSPFQTGAELYGHQGAESDLEVLSLMLTTLAVAQVENIHLDLGHVAIFRELVGWVGLYPKQERLLFEALQRKALPEIRQHLAEWKLSISSEHLLLTLAEMNGGPEILDQAAALFETYEAPVTEAIATLRHVVNGVQRDWPDLPIHIDLAELRGYHYHTGVVFAAYVPGQGQSVAQGGRYDEIGQVFGRARPATGFSTDLATLLRLGTLPQGTPGGIFVPATADDALEQAVKRLRAQGQRAVRALSGNSDSPADLGCDRELRLQEGQWCVVPLSAVATP